MNVVRQPYARLSQTISGGATVEPIAAPLLKIAIPNARSRIGNHSATVLAAPGQFPASPNPSTKRNALKLANPRANAWAIAAMDHKMIEQTKPILVPTRSYSFPESPWLIVYASKNQERMPPN